MSSELVFLKVVGIPRLFSCNGVSSDVFPSPFVLAFCASTDAAAAAAAATDVDDGCALLGCSVSRADAPGLVLLLLLLQLRNVDIFEVASLVKAAV